MTAYASRHDRDRDRTRRALARICGSFGHDLNNIAMLILGQCRAIESLATDEKLGGAAARLEDVTTELRSRLDELALISARAGGRRTRIELRSYLAGVAADLAAEDPERPRLVLGEFPPETTAIGLDEPSFRLALEMLIDLVTPSRPSVMVRASSATAHDLGLPGPAERKAVRIRFEFPQTTIAEEFIRAADVASKAILIGLEDDALALALMKATARRAQGRLESRLQAGNLVLDFVAPQFMDIPSFVAAGPGTARAQPRQSRVLLVEDDYHVRQVTASMFGKIGFEVMAVCDCGEAREALGSDLELDLIVCDYTVPKGRDGEVLKIAGSLRPTTPLICVSGSDQAAEVVSGMAQVRFLRKPYTMADIRDAVARSGIPPCAS